jgi:UDP-glucuronate 4-epimerase
LLDLVAAVERAVGKPAQRKLLPMQAGDVPHTHASPALLKALTGYEPSTPLDTGVRAFVDWYRDYRRDR